LASPALAQQPAAAKPADAADSPAAAAVDATLTPLRRVLVSGQPARFELRVAANEDAEVPATVLRGVHLERAIEDGSPITIGAAVDGSELLAGGTTIIRQIEVDLQVMAKPTGELTRVTVSWPGLSGATTSLEVAPDQSGIDIEALNLAETKVMLVTNFGTMTLRFFPDLAPNHVRNFIKLAKSGFYDGTRFHRVIRNFMIQGGCPNTKEGAEGAPGTGNPGYTIDAEFNDRRHTKGVLSMARGADINSAGSQFFICHGDASMLDGKYTAFGELVDGMDTLDKIADVPVTANEYGETSRPTRPVHLDKAIVLPAFK
jgi:peptidyl-prolyl cis-trans isomerase B (cyclophilin B)